MSEFPVSPAACPTCGDTCEILADETPTSIGPKPEWRPCPDCPGGQLLEAQLTEHRERFWATVPLTDPTVEQINDER